MSSTVAQAALSTRLNNLEVPHRQAKVHTVAHKKVASDQTREESAQLLNRAREISGLTSDRFAREVGMSPTSLSKQISNVEPPQLLRVLFSPMRGHLVQALAERTPGCEVEAVIRLRRAQS